MCGFLKRRNTMSFNQSSNTVSIDVDKDLQHKIENAGSTAEIYQALRNTAEQRGLTEKDAFNGDIVYPTAKAYDIAPAAKTAKIKVGGTEYEITYETQEQLVAAELEIFRELQKPKTTEQEPPTAQARDTRGKFVAGDQQTSDAAIEDYLQRNNIDLSAVREQRYVTDWQSATNEFLARHGDFSGGQRNMESMGSLIIELGLQDSPSADALESAFAELRRRGQYQTDTDEARSARATAAISSASDHESIRNYGRTALGLPQSGFFER
jgi:hypothetical protein